MAVQVDIDVDLLKHEIKKTYARVSENPEEQFIFPTGRSWAADLGYPPDLLAFIPDSAADSFAGVANPFALGPLEQGARVLDIGSGAGTDSLIASQMVGRTGRVTGIDMTPQMLAKAGASASAMEAANVDFVAGEADTLPFDDESFDIVISNGVIDLLPDKDTVFAEIHRVLLPGGRIQFADVTIQRPVSEEGKRNIDLWTG
jgi:SAM-dependent methyltransferase